ncbi:MAG: CoB--CoM heterodisulfide reductase iron-sulfur subunit A family protein, partial [Deltaproteobacteria bacterium]|nr:CoB--CoM heterodisulfide reductase iron-sulfur subunit A family protein [Deltaproteobacteria bacterium]
MSGSILVVGGGFSGLTAAVEAAEMGYDVYIVEKESYMGGRVTQLNKYFPKLCPPTCGLEINYKRVKTSPKITFYNLAEVESVSGGPGDFNVQVKVSPRYTTPQCTNCSAGAEAVATEVPDEFNFGLNTRKSFYMPNMMAFPNQCVLDPSAVSSGDGQQ